jgi:hypothetical protein
MTDEHGPVPDPLEHLEERALVGVCEIEGDRKPGHAIHELAADAAEPTVGALARAVGERVATVPGQRRHAHAQRAEHVDQGGFVAERLHALDRQQQAGAARRQGSCQVGGGAHPDHLRVLGHGAVELADAEQGLAQGQLGQVGLVGEQRADLQLHPARLQVAQPALREGPLLGTEEDELHEQVAVCIREPHRGSPPRSAIRAPQYDLGIPSTCWPR